ncbi:MAG TPA: DUF92 domain-containing protein [Terriglobales bacterium]|nr:DUF92 domain-containing protein [Terriglobales bacterium]
MTASLLAPALVTLAFAAVAYALKGVSLSGAIAGAIVCFTLYVSAGMGAFVALVSVFVLTWLATRFGYSRKQQLGTAEQSHGRNALQVLANLGVASVFAALFASDHNPIYVLAMCGALAEAAADTVSSELGQACATRARLITNFESVPAGTDGGITLIGTLAGLGAAGIVTLICVGMHLIPLRLAAVALLAAFVGTLADSLLGAVLERRGYLNNDMVNFSSTAVTAGFTVLLARLGAAV